MAGNELVAAYRQNAANCVEMAKEFLKPESKLVLLNMAKAWLSMADLVEKFGNSFDSEQPSVPVTSGSQHHRFG